MTGAALERETLREALLALNDLRDREALLLRASNALVSGLEAMSSVETPTEGLRALLGSLRRSFSCDSVAVVEWARGGCAIDHLDGAPIPRLATESAAALFEKPRLAVELDETRWWRPLDPNLGAFRSWLSAPLTDGGGAPRVLACLSTRSAAFDSADRDLLARLARLASQALSTLALAERNRFLAAVIEGSTTSFAIADADAEDRPLVFVNRAFEDLTGFAREEVIGRNCRLLSAEAPDSDERARLREVVRRGEAGRFMLRNRRRSGELFWNDLTLYPIASGADARRYLVATQTDTTAHREREQMLALRAVAIENAEDGVAITDAEGVFSYMNPAHLQMFGYTQMSEVLGQHWSILYDAEMKARLEAEAMPELGRTGAWRGEIRGRAKSGAPVMQEVTLTLVRELGLICVTRDISARLRMEADRARLRERIQDAERQEALGLVTASIAHDLNNMLVAISGSAAMLQGEAQRAAEGAHIERILEASDWARDLLSRMTASNRARDSAIESDLGALMRTAVDLVKPTIPPGVSLSLSLDASAEPILATLDPTDFLQVASNLVLNARDAVGDGPGRIDLALRRVSLAEAPEAMARVETRASRVIGAISPDEEYAVLTVQDDGGGVPAHLIGAMFDPYVSSKGPEGTGLGLSIVAQIMLEAQGAVSLETADGAGASFSVFWPLRSPRAAPAPEHIAATLTGCVILLVDDDPIFSAELGAALEIAGAEVAIASHPADALEALREDPAAWSILVTDFQMPEMDGAELAAAARSLRADLPVLLCSGLRHPAMGDGRFDGVAHKSLGADKIVRVVAQYTGRRSVWPEEEA